MAHWLKTLLSSCVRRLAKSDAFAAGPALFDGFNASIFKSMSYRRFVSKRNWNFPVYHLDAADRCDPNLGCRGQIKGGRSVGNESRRLTFFMLPLSQPDTRSATVLIDELHAGQLEGAPNDIKRRATWLTYPGFKLVHGHDAHARVPSELLLVPSKQTASCSALTRRDHTGKVSKMRDSHNSIKIPLTRA